MSDLIERQAALDKLNELKKVELVNAGNKLSKSYWALQAALMVVSGLPSAEPDGTDTNVGGTIYRQAAIDAMCDACSDWCDEGVCSKVSAIQKLPPAQQWIPCSERLPDHPENDDYYLVTIQCEHYDGWDDYVTGFAEWTKRGWDEVSCYIGQIKVVAWMPLPEPYKEGREV